MAHGKFSSICLPESSFCSSAKGERGTDESAEPGLICDLERNVCAALKHRLRLSEPDARENNI